MLYKTTVEDIRELKNRIDKKKEKRNQNHKHYKMFFNDILTRQNFSIDVNGKTHTFKQFACENIFFFFYIKIKLRTFLFQTKQKFNEFHSLRNDWNIQFSLLVDKHLRHPVLSFTFWSLREHRSLNCTLYFFLPGIITRKNLHIWIIIWKFYITFIIDCHSIYS